MSVIETSQYGLVLMLCCCGILQCLLGSSSIFFPFFSLEEWLLLITLLVGGGGKYIVRLGVGNSSQRQQQLLVIIRFMMPFLQILVSFQYKQECCLNACPKRYPSQYMSHWTAEGSLEFIQKNKQSIYFYFDLVQDISSNDTKYQLFVFSFQFLLF